MNTESKVVLGVLAGIVAGALAGVLFAPAKGSETRKKLIGKGNAYVDGLKNKFSDLTETVLDKLESAENTGTELLEKVSTKTDEAKNAVRNLASSEKNHQNSQTNQNRV